ncbi:hypothetical protein RAD15_19255 [Bradyrhizobium sp. 14AA]
MLGKISPNSETREMGVDIVGNANGWWRVAPLWWFALTDYANRVAPDDSRMCRHWFTSNEDGLDEDQARELAAELQRSIDDCTIDQSARQLFVELLNSKSMKCLVEYPGDDGDPVPDYSPDERRFVNDFICQVQSFVDFLLSCRGFRTVTGVLPEPGATAGRTCAHDICTV